jgi:5-methylcytosine-specific restriction protein A
MSRSSRPRPWQRDELILALELYFKKGGKVNETDPDTIRLAKDLNILNRLRDGDKAAVRNPNSVDMKAWNFHRFDGNYMASGRKALRHGNKLDEVIWNEFSTNQASLSKASSAIRAQLTSGHNAKSEVLPEVEESIAEASEGALLTRLHLYRERNRKLVRLRKEQVFKKNGSLKCEVCGFDYGQIYGPRGQGFIECHHIKPLNAYKAKEVTRLEDLALVCANCHRMIHSQRPWLTLSALKEILQQQK